MAAVRIRLVIVLALIVITPLAIAGWLGARIVRDERLMVDHRTRSLVIGQLRAVADDLDDLLARYAGDVLAETAGGSASMPQGQVRTPESLLIRQYYRVAADGALVHPPLDDPASLPQSHRDALERTRRVWESSALRSIDGEAESSYPPIARPSASRESAADVPGLRWHAWYWGDGLHWLLWYQDAGGVIHAFELDRPRLLSEIVASLPDTDPAGSGRGGRLRLVDAGGKSLYEWGEHEPPEGEIPFETLALGHPLAAWTLEFYAPAGMLGRVATGGLVLNLVAGMGLLVVAVLAAGAWLYREQTRNLREAEQRVSFVNQVSHELKTPLTNIRLYAEMLEERVPSDDETSRRHAGIVVAESRRLSRLIGNILTFSRQQRNGLEIARRPGVVDDAVRTCLDHFRPALDAKGVSVECELAAAGRVAFDADILEQILGNLVGNVEKYAADGKLMKVRSAVRGSEVEIIVSDAGRGIPAQERERIFRPFHRVENRPTEGAAGTGIGLSIARDLARLHGGDLVVVPTEAGARFRLTLDCPSSDGDDA